MRPRAWAEAPAPVGGCVLQIAAGCFVQRTGCHHQERKPLVPATPGQLKTCQGCPGHPKGLGFHGSPRSAHWHVGRQRRDIRRLTIPTTCSLHLEKIQIGVIASEAKQSSVSLLLTLMPQVYVVTFYKEEKEDCRVAILAELLLGITPIYIFWERCIFQPWTWVYSLKRMPIWPFRGHGHPEITPGAPRGIAGPSDASGSDKGCLRTMRPVQH